MSNSLLKKYNIPISHLDFDYIKKSDNVRELEKIVMILESGQEGYYPDLTKSAVEKLQSLKPNSKILRKEVPVLNKRSMDTDQWDAVSSEINGWTEKMKEKGDSLRESRPTTEISYSTAPIRQYVNETSPGKDAKNENVKRIKSCDYAQWDKYDPDVEMLKMDLNEERDGEAAKIKNKNRKMSMIDANQIDELVGKLSITEKEVLANKHRIKGNEFYRASEYSDAVLEYTLSINIFPTASAFNNRAMTHLKMKNMEMAIADCEECLKLDPNNMKALQRKAQALWSELKYREAYDECGKILLIDTKNEWAKNKVAEIKSQIPDLPPTNAFRMKIIENESIKVDKPVVSQRKYHDTSTKIADEFAELIIPTNIIPSKLAQLKSNFVLNKNVEQNKKGKLKQQCNDESNIVIPTDKIKMKNKISEYSNGVVIEEL